MRIDTCVIRTTLSKTCTGLYCCRRCCQGPKELLFIIIIIII